MCGTRQVAASHLVPRSVVSCECLLSAGVVVGASGRLTLKRNAYD